MMNDEWFVLVSRIGYTVTFSYSHPRITTPTAYQTGQGIAIIKLQY